jgi:hypothetical protein
MPETFLILLAGGVLLAAAISSSRQVTVQWLRLAGILGLSFAGLAVFFAIRREPLPEVSPLYRRIQWGMLALTILTILAHLGFVQVLFLRTQRVLAGVAFALAVIVGSGLLHEMVPVRGVPPGMTKPQAMALQTIACAGVGALAGLALMDMLLGHAYLTAARMTIAPFRRLNLAVAAVLGLQAATGLLAILLQPRFPTELFWARFGLLVGTRWFVGILVPCIFIYMAHDCIKRRSTQSATGILYVAGVLIFIGELVALYLAGETGLPF